MLRQPVKGDLSRDSGMIRDGFPGEVTFKLQAKNEHALSKCMDGQGDNSVNGNKIQRPETGENEVQYRTENQCGQSISTKENVGNKAGKAGRLNHMRPLTNILEFVPRTNLSEKVFDQGSDEIRTAF